MRARVAAALRLVAVAVVLAVGCARATVFDFSSAAQLENNFAVYTSGTQEEGRYLWTDAPGAGGQPGQIAIEPVFSQSLSVLFSSFTFDLNTNPVEVSMLFQGGATAGGSVPRIGLLLHTEQGALNLTATRLRFLWLQDGQGVAPARLLAGSGDGTAHQDNLTAFVAGHWYGMRVLWSLDEKSGAVRIAGELWDYGATGTQPLSRIAQLTALVTDPSLFGAGGVVRPLYLGIVAQHGLGGAAALDQIRIEGDFSAVFIPEPALTATCLLGGTLLVCALRRRNRRRRHERNMGKGRRMHG